MQGLCHYDCCNSTAVSLRLGVYTIKTRLRSGPDIRGERTAITHVALVYEARTASGALYVSASIFLRSPGQGLEGTLSFVPVSALVRRLGFLTRMAGRHYNV